MFGLKDQSWPQSNGCGTTTSTVDTFFAQVIQNLVTPLKENVILVLQVKVSLEMSFKSKTSAKSQKTRVAEVKFRIIKISN